MDKQHFQIPGVWSQWSNRILILSLIGIVYLTLFPFRLDFANPQSRTTSPFLLGPSLKQGEYVPFLLNVLLFVPFGFGLGAQLRRRGVSKLKMLFLALAAGAIVSYGVEFLQFYIPTRNSSWDDVTPNTLGAVIGALLLDPFGERFLRPLSRWEHSMDALFTPRRAASFCIAYMGILFLISIALQRETRLSNWDAEVPMFVGSDGTARHAWKGQIATLQMWNRALSDESARKLTSGEPLTGMEKGLLASYEFTGSPPYEDQQKSHPALVWVSSSAAHDSNLLDLNGSSWLSTKVPVTKLAQELKRTNQFTLRAICTPADSAELDQFIVSVGNVYGTPDMTLRRDGLDLVLWYRNPISVHRSFLNFRARGALTPGEPSDVLVSNDGSNISLFVNGRRERFFHLSPGTALVHKFAHVFAFDLDGYLVLYDTLIFLPTGMLLGMAARNHRSPSKGGILLALGILLPPVIYQFILMGVSGKAIFWREILLCAFLSLLGAIFINSDRASEAAPLVA